ncbi:hypothetical protein HZH68_005390 [Vespula germanica]|uniref:Uncharacterized protein n=1 Tax=Vespula germanica TaxID=30212 RepID=A0A834KL39_VESGE|nr:hypothetical protein HZH68_005390 [Vespula germanica]
MLLPLLILETISQGVLGEAPSGTCYVLSNASHGNIKFNETGKCECLARSTCSTNGRYLERTPRRLNYRRDSDANFVESKFLLEKSSVACSWLTGKLVKSLGTLDEQESKGMDYECVGVE